MPDGFLQRGSIAYQQRLSAAFIAQISDALTILAPKRIGFAHPGRRRQIPNRTIFHRHAENIAAGGDKHALAARGQLRGSHVLCRVLPLRPRLQGLRLEADHERLNLAAHHIERFQLTARLVHDGVIVGARVAHIPRRFMRELSHRMSARVVEIQIGRPVVTIGDKGHIISHPHRIAVRGVHVRNFFQLIAGRIDYPNRRRIAAAMLAPTTDPGVGHDVRAVSQAPAIGRPRPLDGNGLHDFLFVPPRERHLIELTAAAVGDLAIRGKQHPLAVRAPSRDHVRCGMPGKTPRLTTCRGHHIDIDIVVVAG